MFKVRPLADHDVDAVAAVQIASFDDYDRRFGNPVPDVTSERVDNHRRRVRHFLTHDPDGSWVAESDGQVVGTALALRRDRLWGLSLLAVLPSTQSGGAGRALLDAALGYADPEGPAVILSSRDPRAMHRYASAGFDLHPQMQASGTPDLRSRPPDTVEVRDGTAADFELADAVDVAVRGAARGADHEIIASMSVMFVADRGDHRGYAYLQEGRVRTIAATDEPTALALLWRSLAHARDLGVEATVEHMTANQQWAVRTVVQARLSLAPSGPAFWRHGTPPPTYLPSGPYL